MTARQRDAAPPARGPRRRRPHGIVASAALLTLLALLTGGCGGTRKPHGPAAPAHMPAARQVPTAKVRATGQRREVTAEEYAAVERLMREAERIRGLRFKQPVAVQVEDATAIQAYVHDELEPEELEISRSVYVALGLLPADLDVEALLIRLMGEQVIGYYDASKKRLVVRDDVMHGLAQRGRFAGAQEVLVHELVHALQDQHFDLGATLEQTRTTDADSALRALIEGDATLAMVGLGLDRERVRLSQITRDPVRVAYLRQVAEASARESPELSRAPAIVRIPMLSAYADGVVYAASLHGRGGWAALDRAHRQPPTSTEVVLHPDATVPPPESQPALHVVDAMAGLGFDRLEHDSLGELELGVYFGRALSRPAAKAAAAGWDGDTLEVYRHPDSGRLAVVWLTRWDSPEDARRALAAAHKVRLTEPPEIRKTCAVERRGQRVLILRGVPSQSRQELVAAALAAPQ